MFSLFLGPALKPIWRPKEHQYSLIHSLTYTINGVHIYNHKQYYTYLWVM